MHIIYATGKPRSFEFDCARTRSCVPAGATVFAVCDEARTVEYLDASVFEAMSDEEYYTMRGWVRDAVQLEAQAQSGALLANSPLRQLLSRLRGAKPVMPVPATHNTGAL